MPIQPILRMVVFVLIVLVLARPQTQNSWKNKTMEGIDIMLAMDVSTSMLAEDLKPNRMEAAKQVAAEFITGALTTISDCPYLLARLSPSAQ